jgi:hypothetical protein
VYGSLRHFGGPQKIYVICSYATFLLRNIGFGHGGARESLFFADGPKYIYVGSCFKEFIARNNMVQLNINYDTWFRCYDFFSISSAWMSGLSSAWMSGLTSADVIQMMWHDVVRDN